MIKNQFHQLLSPLQRIFQFEQLHFAQDPTYPKQHYERLRFQVFTAVGSHTKRQRLHTRQEERTPISTIFSDVMRGAKKHLLILLHAFLSGESE